MGGMLGEGRDLPITALLSRCLQWLGLSQESAAKTFTRQGPMNLDHLLVPSQTHRQDAGLELEHLGPELAPI